MSHTTLNPSTASTKDATVTTNSASKKKIQKWIDKFNAIPRVNAALLHDENKPEMIIDIDIPGSFVAFISDEKYPTPVISIALQTNKEFKHYYSDGKLDSICSKWLKEFASSNASNWGDVYQWVSKLIKRYQKTVPVL